MSIAEELKKENTMADVFAARPNFREHVASDIKSYGRCSILHGNHICQIGTDAIPERYVRAVVGWAESEGLSVEYGYNTYGVGVLRLSI